MLSQIRDHIGNALWKRSIKRDLSRFGWREAPAYTCYHRRCQSEFSSQGKGFGAFKELSEYFAANQFVFANTTASTKLLTTMADRVKAELTAGRDPFAPGPFSGEGWNRYPELEELFRGDLGDLLRAAFRSEFKIASGWLGYKKGGVEARKMWHADSGPGTRLNVFVYLSEGQLENAPTSLLPWQESADIFFDERRWLRQHFANDPAAANIKRRRMEALADYYESEIARRCPDKVTVPHGPAGLMVVFNNNILHAATTPKTGHDRMVAIFAVYPALSAPDFSRLARVGLPGKAGNPLPDADF
jgi:hypothetical protein